MFYRIKNNKICDFADYKYTSDCLETDICTMQEFIKNPEKYNIKDKKLEILSNWESILAQKRRDEFEKSFFHTSLGWIKRKVTMKDGTIKDFLSDLLLHIKAGLDLGQDVKIITYHQPDFSEDLTDEIILSLQEKKSATQLFVQECLLQTVSDFAG